MDASAQMTSKGQVTVPKAVRDALGLEAGDRVSFRVSEGKAILSRTPDLLELAGSVDVPLGKRGTPWDEVRRSVRSERARRRS
jgi:antitoxin PrlF